MKLRHLFRAYKPGDYCDGLIALHRLSTNKLEAQGLIRERGGRWVFVGMPGKAVA